MIEMISSRELENLLISNRALLIDVRNRKEYESGYICGAINIPYESPGWEDEIKKIALSNKQKSIVAYCQRGATSVMVARWMNTQGYGVKSLVGGFSSYKGKKICRQ